MSGQEGSKSRWSEIRDLFAATREAMIVLAVLLVLLAPSMVRASLQRAGITAFAGVEFNLEDVVDAGQQVALAEAEVAKLSQQLASVEQQLAALSMSGSPARPDQLRQLADSVHTIQSQASEANASLAKTTQKIDRAIQLMPPDKLRELAKRNRQQAASPKQPTPLPRLDSATLRGDLRTPNTGITHTGIPNSGIPNSGIPNSGIPNSGIPNSGIPNSGIPNSGIPSARVPDRSISR